MVQSIGSECGRVGWPAGFSLEAKNVVVDSDGDDATGLRRPVSLCLLDRAWTLYLLVVLRYADLSAKGAKCESLGQRPGICRVRFEALKARDLNDVARTLAP